jgi:Flp pilus assembly protein TadG
MGVRGLMVRVRDERGVIEIIVAISLVMLMGFVALVVDIGNAKQVGRNLQTGVDSGAAAGAQQLQVSVAGAQTFAAEYTFDSLDETRGGTVGCPSALVAQYGTSGTTVCYQSGSGPIVLVTTPWSLQAPPCTEQQIQAGRCAPPAGSTPPSNQVINVTACQTVNTTFARVININTTHPCKSATAELVPGVSGPPCAICIMSKTASPALYYNGNTTFTVSGGPVVVNSSSSGGINESGSAGSFTVASPGQITWYGCGSATCPVGGYSPAPVRQSYQIPDPLSFLPEPTNTTPAGTCTKSGNTETCTPGVYSTLNSLHNGTTTLQAGTYIITNSLNLKQGDTMNGTGVTIYLACSSYPTPCASGGQNGAQITFNGGTLNLSSPPAGMSYDPTHPYNGLVLFADRNNTSSMLSFNGNPSITLKGTIYGLSSPITLGGTAGMTLDSLIVTATMDLQGTSGSNAEVPADQVQIPPTPPSFNLIG